MIKSANIKRVISFIMAAAICLFAMPQAIFAEEEPAAYALKGTINSMLEIASGRTEWGSSDQTGTINVQLQEPAAGSIFTAYRLLDIKNVDGRLQVEVPNNAQDFWKYYLGTQGKAAPTTVKIGNIKDAIDGIGSGAGSEAAKSSSIVNAFVDFTGTKPDAIDSAPVDSTTAKINTDKLGFYIIQQTGAPANGYIASAPILVCLPMQDETIKDKWYKVFTVVPKDKKVEITKQVQASGDTGFKDETITNIGDALSYEITATLPTYGYDTLSSGITYVLKDKLPEGISDPTSIEVSLKAVGGDYAPTAEYTPSYDSPTRTMTLTIPAGEYKNVINGNYEKIKITYNSSLNNKATIEGEIKDAIKGNANTVTLEYTTKSGATQTLTEDAKVYTMRLDITKVAKTGEAPLAGAEFEVYTDKNNPATIIEFVDITPVGDDQIKTYRVATADDAVKVTKITVTDSADLAIKGKVSIVGLNDATYSFKETKAPTGYNIPSEMFDIEVKPTLYSDGLKPDDYTDASSTVLDFDTNYQSEKITNSTGIDLPVTGGIGTILFTAIGVLLMAGAAYFLLRSKKRSN